MLIWWMGLFIIPMMIAVACAVDIGYIAATSAELQNVADAAALAGATQLRDRDALNGSPNQTSERTAARALAQAFAAQNVAGLDQSGIPFHPSLVDADIVTGYLADPAVSTGDPVPNITAASNPPPPSLLKYSPSFTTPADSGYRSDNSVQVQVLRNSARNSALTLFFGGFANRSTQNLLATATATAEDNIIGFQVYPNSLNRRMYSSAPMYEPYSNLLPFAMSVNDYGSMIVGVGAAYNDINSYTPNSTLSHSSRVAPGPDGIHEITLNYAGSNPNLVGIRIGASAPSSDLFLIQVTKGPDGATLGANFRLGSGGTLSVPDYAVPSDLLFKINLSLIITSSTRGQPRVIALYDPASGPGSTNHTIVGFAGIVILTAPPLTPGPISMRIQPEFVIDSTAVGGGSLITATTGAGTSAFVYRPVALSR